jgi:ABC-type Na+ efflux pump permease subunit
MGLTWRDAVSSCAIVVIVISYAVYRGGTGPLLISSTRATSAVVLVLGIGCAVVASGDLYTRPQPRMGQVFRWIATGFGTVAVIAGLIGLITGSTYALTILVVATIAGLATGIFWHVLTIGSDRSDEPS